MTTETTPNTKANPWDILRQKEKDGKLYKGNHPRNYGNNQKAPEPPKVNPDL